MTTYQQGVSPLTERHFEECALWKSSEDARGYFPVRGADELPNLSQDLLIKADFVSPTGLQYRGYIVGISRVISIGLFVNGNIFFFNSNLIDLSHGQLAKMQQARQVAGDQSDPVFPLRFTTAFNLPGYNNFTGTFDLPGKNAQ